MTEFKMPSLGADMDEGKLVEWLVKVGDVVHKGDVVAVVDTAKADIEVECFTDGTVESLLVQPGQTVPVGAPLAILTGPAEAGTAPVSEPARTPVAEPAAAAGPLIRRLASQLGVDLAKVRGTGRGGAITRADVQKAGRAPLVPAARTPVEAAPRAAREQSAAPSDRAKVSPYARRLATQLGVDLAAVQAHGPDQVVGAEDVQRAADAAGAKRAEPAKRASVAPTAGSRAGAMRQATARLMARSKREIPHYYLSTTIDVTDALAWLRDRNKERTVQDRILPAALLLKAAAVALAHVPELNGHWTDDRFQPGERIDLGVAVAVRGGGLVTPAIVNAAELDLPELMGRLRDLIVRARRGHLRGGELTAGTITVTNLGDLGVEAVYGVIYPPQVALVGFGRVVQRPWVVDDHLEIRSVVTITLSADHRATDGHTGARFLDQIAQLLRQPEKLWKANQQ